MQNRAKKGKRVMNLYSYVVEHDEGRAPNPYFGVCTLCRCKYRDAPWKPKNIVELANKGDWIVGTGGANQQKSAGHGKLVYAMRVDDKLTREKYYADRRFARKRVENSLHGDNEPPVGVFEARDQFALISRHFYYFGASAIHIPRKFRKLGLEKKGPGFRCDFSDAPGFVEWIEAHEPGKRGEPCTMDKSKGSRRCKSSC